MKKQLVLLLYYTLVICPDKFDFELTAENNSQLFWFASSMIDSIVFVLFAGESKVDIFAWIGRTDTFISNDNSSFNFPCESPPFTLRQSVSKSIWIDIARVRRTFRRLLSSSSLHQGSFSRRSDVAYISVDTFAHIQQQARRLGVSEGNGRASEIMYEVKDGLQLFSRKQSCQSQTLEFKGTSGVKALTKIFGAFAVIGIRRRRPKLKDCVRKLQCNDGVHHLTEKEGEVNAKLDYAQDMGRMKITIAYSLFYPKWIGTTGSVNNPPTNLLKQALEYNIIGKQGNTNNETVQDRETSLLGHGTLFVSDGKLCTIVSLEIEPMMAYMDDEDNHFLLNKDVLKELVVAYLE